METTTATGHALKVIGAADRANNTARCTCGLYLKGVSVKDARDSIRRHAARANARPTMARTA